MVPATAQVHAPFRAAGTPYPLGAATVLFCETFDRYVNPNGKIKAASVWQDLASERSDGEVGLAAEIGAAFDAGLLKQHPYNAEMRYRHTFENFLGQRRWLDRVVSPSSPEARAGPPPRAADPYAHLPRTGATKR